MNKLKKPLVNNVVHSKAMSGAPAHKVIKQQSLPFSGTLSAAAVNSLDHSNAAPPLPRTPTEQYWAARAIAAESMLSARASHQQELRAASYREELKRSKDLAALSKANDEKHKSLERLVLILLACVVALISGVIFLAARAQHRVEVKRPWWTSPSHFTIPILSPFTSVVEQETSVVGSRVIAVLIISIACVGYFSLLLLWITAATAMRIVSYNLRFDSKPDNITVQQTIASLPDPLQAPRFLNGSSERPWSTRRIRVAEHLLSFQEALVRQVHDLAELFGDGWSWIGVGRDNGVEAGEFSPIFYKKSELTLLSNDSFWTSNTPFEPSKFPGAGSFRVVTAAHFTLTGDGVSAPINFTYLNTHMDDQSDDQRKLAASMLLIRARFEAVKTGSPVIITGDYNSPPTGTDSGAYKIITGASPPVPVNATFAAKFAVADNELPDFKLLDLRAEAPRQNVSANFATFTGFTSPTDTSNWARIDFVFGGSNGGWKTNGYKVASALADDGVLESDHRPVFADIQFGS
ncbi:hypothetical protein HGRIS_012513 [Hohenbuehelia grisea]|uniref:Endonuclease/exonuclease/phosphatase domain-containing protein n=1 Tax=Hohenbuehelia grisea TaxID=104357 RepID=A0ABR3ISK3_9AGAR